MGAENTPLPKVTCPMPAQLALACAKRQSRLSGEAAMSIDVPNAYWSAAKAESNRTERFPPFAKPKAYFLQSSVLMTIERGNLFLRYIVKYL